MGAFTDLSDYVNRMTGGNSGAPENLFVIKEMAYGAGTVVANAGAHSWWSTWRWDGIPSAGAVAAAAAAPTKATTGALQFTNSAGSAVKRLVQAIMGVANAAGIGQNSVILMDRLLHVGGLSGTSTSAQNVQSGSGVSLSRYTGGVGNQIWVEIQTAIGVTARTVTASYTNQAGTASRTTIARRIGGDPGDHIHSVYQLPLQAGDTGVQSVETITLSASTGTAGDIAVVVYHPIALFPGSHAVGPFGSFGEPCEVVDDACLMFLWQMGASRSSFAGHLSMVDV